MFYPRVSVVVISHNRKRTLKKCVESLLLLKYPNYEIIVIDDGSRDGSVQMLKEEYPSVKLIYSNKNFSAVFAHNLGVKNTDGKYIVRVDDDVELDSNFISKLVKVMENDKSIGILGGKIYWHRTNKLWCVGGKINFLTGGTTTLGEGEVDYGQYDKIREVDYIGCCMFVRREVYEKVGLLDLKFSPVYYEDVEFNVRAKKAGYKIVFVPTAIAYHLQQKRNPSLRKVLIFQTHRLMFLLKHFGGQSVC